MSSESGPQTSTFKHGYEDSDVVQHATAGQMMLLAGSLMFHCNAVLRYLYGPVVAFDIQCHSLM